MTRPVRRLLAAALPPLPAGEVASCREGAVGSAEWATISVPYRCQRPWIVSGIDVDVTQGAVSGSGTDSRTLTPHR